MLYIYTHIHLLHSFHLGPAYREEKEEMKHLLSTEPETLVLSYETAPLYTLLK